jgi:hypothetical protein
VLRCDQPGLPTADCLCRDVTEENVLLKIWNRNGDSGIIGAFHARSGESVRRDHKIHGAIGASDVPGLSGAAFACYAWVAKTLYVLEAEERREAALAQGEFELFTLVPMRRGFAAIGLSDKMNSRGAVKSENHFEDRVELELLDGGEFLAISERAPRACDVAGKPVLFSYESDSKILRSRLDAKGGQRLTVHF